jgi:hypothetical protein
VRFQLGSPSGWLGSFIEAGSADEAIAIAEAPPYREQVLDVMDHRGEDGEPVILLVVADEPLPATFGR